MLIKAHVIILGDGLVVQNRSHNSITKSSVAYILPQMKKPRDNKQYASFCRDLYNTC